MAGLGGPVTLTGHDGGTLAVLKRSIPGERRGGGRRGKVAGFSAESRRRAIRFLASVNEERTADGRFFVTLTYPGQFPASAREWKRHLNAFGVKLRRLDRFQAAMWKLEPQKRGAPHFHLLLFVEEVLGPDGSRERDLVGYLRRWISRAWLEAVGSGRAEHLAAGTQCDRVKSWAGCAHYTAKYLAKVATVPEDLGELWRHAGRWWGKWGTFAVDAETVHLTDAEFFRVRRVFRAWRRRQTGRQAKTWGVAGLSTFLQAATVRQLVAWVQS